MKKVIISSFLVASACRPQQEVDPELPPRVLVSAGAALSGANGLHFGPDGLLYVASVLGGSITALDPETGAIELRLGPAEQVRGPDDLAFGPDGALYWTDFVYGEVGRRDPDGSTRIIASPGPGVNPVTVSDDGRVFVAQCFLASNLYEIDPSGATEPRLISDQLGPGCGLNAMDWGPDGQLYGPRWFAGSVVRVDVDTGEFETVAPGFATPAAVKFDSQGLLYVLDTAAAEVVRVNLETDARELVASFDAPGLDNLAFDSDDRLFVSSYADGYVVEVTGPETLRVVSPGGMIAPGGLTLLSTPAGPRLFIADFFALRELDPVTGAELSAVRDIIGVTPLGTVVSVQAYGSQLLLTSWFDNEVKIWDPASATLVDKFGDFLAPVDALPFAGDIVVSSYGTGEVLRFDPANPDARTVIASGLAEPAGLAASSTSLYVADRGAGTILELVKAGQSVSPPRVVVSGLEAPEGLAVASDGSILVVEVETGRVLRVNPDTAALTLIAEGLELGVPSQSWFPSTMLLSGVAVAGDTVYVSADREKAVYRIELQ